ncbi:hypothetical protein ACWD3I_24890 [Streptomyces sp. NPDC002817]
MLRGRRDVPTAPSLTMRSSAPLHRRLLAVIPPLESPVPSLAAPPATAPGPGPDMRSQQYLEQAAAAGVLDLDEPETLVVADVPQADGGLFSCTAWTPGAARLGDHIDQVALAGRLDACSWIEILDRHSRTTHHGQTVIRTYRLRPYSPTSRPATAAVRTSGPTSPASWPPTPRARRQATAAGTGHSRMGRRRPPAVARAPLGGVDGGGPSGRHGVAPGTLQEAPVAQPQSASGSPFGRHG